MDFLNAPALWIPAAGPDPENWTDRYAAFRGTIELGADVTVTLRIFGAHFFSMWLDSGYLTEGPYRFPPDHPEYETLEIKLARGRHVLAALVRSEGIETRILQSNVIHPFLMVQVLDGGNELPIAWKAAPLPGYIASGQRLSPQFAWIEWVDTRLNPHDWHQPEFDDTAWGAPTEVTAVSEWKIGPVNAERLKRLRIEPKRIGEGSLAGPFEHAERPGWQTDDGFPWYRRNLQPTGRANGTWRRYDLHHVQLGRPEFVLDVPAGTIVEIAWAECLREGRVTPFVPLSLGPSRNMDHFVARGGEQTFAPLVPKGGRFLEIHIGAPPDEVKFVKEVFWQRTYYDRLAGDFQSGDEMLDRIWMLGIDTLRGCSEDAITDNPTRERGQWTGDVLLSLYVAVAGFNDVRLFRRALQHSAYCARADGLVAGLSPGNPGYLPTYSAQWATSVVNYHRMTGDRALLEELFPYAVRNFEVFEKELTPDGIRSFEWPFVDWGYPGCEGSTTEMGMNLHVLEATRSMQKWCGLVGGEDGRYRRMEARLQDIIGAWLQPRLEADAWERIGYHCATLALRNRLIPEAARSRGLAYLKRHMLACFPNDPGAPSLESPDYRSPQLITPYFAYYSFAELAAAGEIDFILDQYRSCWGWALAQGLTTQPEVFDLNWSHCHVWASSPTAQLTRHLLGLEAHFSEGLNHYDWTLNPGSSNGAKGKIPLVGQRGAISVAWKKIGPDRIEYEIESPQPVWIHVKGATAPISVPNRARLLFQLSGQGWTPASS